MSVSMNLLPFEDVKRLVRDMPSADNVAAQKARLREAELTKPAGSLGRLEDIAEWISAWQGRHPPQVIQPQVAVFAGGHGVNKHNVSAFPVSVNGQMLNNFQKGGAAINQLCEGAGAGLKVFELGVDVPTGDITIEPAMSEKECVSSFAYGMEALAQGGDLLCLGEMGIGNTTISAAVCAGLFGGDAEQWVGAGSGVTGDALQNKKNVVQKALETHKAILNQPLEVLRCLGGRELAAICGAIVAARYQKVPVILDGFITCAAAAVLYSLDKSSLDHCLFAHCSAESGHRLLLDKMDKKPLLDLGLRLGEASGATLAVSLVKAALACHNQMATFAEAGVCQAVA